MRLSDYVRTDLLDFAGYGSARAQTGDAGAPRETAWLNANESPYPSPASAVAAASRRYPEAEQAALRAELAGLWGVEPASVLVCRGSDEGIDVLLRACCEPGRGAVVVAPPTFGMYAVSARLHGAAVHEVPLVEEGGRWRTDLDALAARAEATGAELVFVCSPNNPTGHLVPLEGVAALARRLQGRALLVVDEAYLEYAQAGDPTLGSAAELLGSCENVAVLRTLSKAHGLAGARVGAVLAGPDLVRLLRRVQAPYPLATPAVQAALEAVRADAGGSALAVATDATRAQARRLHDALVASAQATRAYEPAASFVLARFADPDATLAALAAESVVVRDLRATPGLGDALRISAGTPEQVDAVLRALGVPVDPRPTPGAAPAQTPTPTGAPR